LDPEPDPVVQNINVLDPEPDPVVQLIGLLDPDPDLDLYYLQKIPKKVQDKS
jgi:hypothetical protein